jgi:uncharacterized protein DUF433
MPDESESLARQNNSSPHWQRWAGIHMKRVLIDPAVHHGQPVVLGTRVAVTQIAGSLAGGMSFKDIEALAMEAGDRMIFALLPGGTVVMCVKNKSIIGASSVCAPTS